VNSESQRRLWRTAATLGRERRQGKGLPVVWFVSDPDRTPDPVSIAGRLPAGTGIILRHFGRPEAGRWADALADVAFRRGLVLLIAADPDLAAKVGAGGVHMPERMIGSLPRLRLRHPTWIVTASAHSLPALGRARLAGADAALLSAIFPSRSASAGRPLGPIRLANAVRAAGVPVFALGGVNADTAPRLIGTEVAGFAAVEAFGG